MTEETKPEDTPAARLARAVEKVAQTSYSLNAYATELLEVGPNEPSANDGAGHSTLTCTLCLAAQTIDALLELRDVVNHTDVEVEDGIVKGGQDAAETAEA